MTSNDSPNSSLGSSANADKHRFSADSMPPVRVAVVTVSDTRTYETDESGRYVRGLLEAHGHQVVEYQIIRDEPIEIQAALMSNASNPAVQTIIFNGGTGISKRDSTVEVVEPILEKVLPGFGEIFRMLSWEEIGPASILSRAVGGIYLGKLVFCLPGSRGAVELAMGKIISPELKHFIWEITR